MGLGIQPDILICRTEKKFEKDSKKKISLFCNLSLDSVIMLEDADTIYEVPIKLYNEGLLKKLFSNFNFKSKAKLILNHGLIFQKKLIN